MDKVDQNILVAVDHSNQAENAVKFYLEKVHRPGNKVVFVNCVELPELSIGRAKDSHMSPTVLANMWKEEEARTKVLEEKLTALLKEKKVPGKLRTSAGKPGELICQIAEEENAAMIITGTRGMGKMRRTILGSVSDYLVNHASCPVMVCRDPSDVERRRNLSGELKKLRHASGDSLNSFAANLRQRFSSGNKSRSQSASSDKDEAKREKENQEVKENIEEETPSNG